MKKIIGIIHPFDAYQVFYVYQDGNKLDIIKTTIDDIPTTVVQLAEAYDTKEVNLSGAKKFAKGIVKKIQELEMTKYSKLNLDIKII